MQVTKDGKVIDADTGEVIESVGDVKDLVVKGREDPIEALFGKDANKKPIHVRLAEENNVPVHVMSSYVGHAPDGAGEHLNVKTYLIGAIPYFSGRFSPKVTDPSQPGYKTGEGFYTFLIKTDETRPFRYTSGEKVITVDVPVIIKCDGVKIRDTIAQLIGMFGYYDWKDAVTGEQVKVPVVFQQAPDRTFYIQILPE